MDYGLVVIVGLFIVALGLSSYMFSKLLKED